MKTFLFFFACLAGLMAGCSTVGDRIQEKSVFFDSLDPQTQTRLKQGFVGIGDSSDMVYIAVGRPDRVKQQVSADGLIITWIYTAYRQEYEGSHFVGYERRMFFDSQNRAWRIYYEPVHADLYSEREDDYLRVLFKDDKVTTIEQIKQR
jgi:hypothetical protein